MSDIKVSFIIPAYNVEAYIRDCLDSVLAQKIEKEIIVINDGSTDRTGEIIQEYAKSYPCIKIINKKNQGLSSARNDGVAVARGEYLCFIDGDDYYLKDFAGKFHVLCKKHKLDIIRGWYAKIYDDRCQMIIHPVTFINKPMRSYDYLVSSVKQKAMEVVSVVGFIKRDFYIRNGLNFPEGLYYEDQLFYLKMLLSTGRCRIMQVNECFYGYRMREGSITRTPNRKKMYDLVKIMRKQKFFIDDLNLKDEYKKAANRVMSGTMNHLISLYLRLSPYDQRMTKRAVPYGLRFRALRYSNNPREFIKTFIFILSPQLLIRLFNKKI